MKIKNKKIKTLFFLVTAIFVVIFSVNKKVTMAVDCSALEGEEKESCEKSEDKIDDLDEKAKTYQKIIDLKQSQQNNLSNQINSLNSEITVLENEIKDNKNEVVNLNNQIDVLEGKIKQKEEIIVVQKKILAELIRAYYEYKQRSIAFVVLANEGMSNFMIEKDHLAQTGDSVKEILTTLKSLKTSLENEQKSLEESKKKIIEARHKLEEKNAYLDSSKIQKESLLGQTKGEEQKYKKLLARVEKQKQELLGDIDELFSANSAEINAWSASLAKPKSGLASLKWYYSQKDPRWGNKKIGNSNSLMKDYGCAITCVSMVFTYHDEDISPGSLCKQPIFYWDLIKWPSSWKGLELVTNTYHSGVNWNTVDKELKKDNPVIVFIKAKGGAGHYVVIHGKSKNGKYVVHDPYFGSNIFLDSSVSLLSKLYKVSIPKSAIDQMILYK